MNTRPNATQLRRDPLVLASLAFLAANLLHGFDHLRTGTERLTTEVSLGGFLITIAALAMVYLALRGFPPAPLIAILIGSWSGVLIASAHFAPHWSALSDSYWDLKPDAFSWAVAAAEVTAALGLFLVGLSTIRRQAAGPANSISTEALHMSGFVAAVHPDCFSAPRAVLSIRADPAALHQARPAGPSAAVGEGPLTGVNVFSGWLRRDFLRIARIAEGSA